MRRILILLVPLVLLSFPGVVWAYRYFEAEDLERDLATMVGEKVKFVDEIVTAYPDRQTVPGYFKFDTVHFRCFIPESATEAVDYVKEATGPRVKGARRTKRLVEIQGTVERREVYGDVKGKEAGVTSETILIVVDTAKKPRDRYYREAR
jgi:hypothetical protein